VRIITKDGTTFEGRTPEALARKLYLASRAWHENERDFTRQVARRVMLWNGKKIRTGTAGKFISDLLSAGLIRQIRTGKGTDKRCV
jgi:hypothetical protein